MHGFSMRKQRFYEEGEDDGNPQTPSERAGMSVSIVLSGLLWPLIEEQLQVSQALLTFITGGDLRTPQKGDPTYLPYIAPRHQTLLSRRWPMMLDFPFLLPWIEASMLDTLRCYIPRPLEVRGPIGLPSAVLGQSMAAQGLLIGARFRGEALEAHLARGYLVGWLRDRWVRLTDECPSPDLIALQAFHRQRFLTYFERTIIQRLLKRPGFLWFHGMIEHPRRRHAYAQTWATELERWLQAHALSWQDLGQAGESNVVCLNTGLMAGPQHRRKVGTPDSIAREVLLLAGGSLVDRLGGDAVARPLLRNALARRACEWADFEQTFQTMTQRLVWLAPKLNMGATTLGRWLGDASFEDPKVLEREIQPNVALQQRISDLLQERSPGWLTPRDVTDYAWEHWPRPYPDAAVIAEILEGMAHSSYAKRRGTNRDGLRTVEYSALETVADYSNEELRNMRETLPRDVRHLYSMLTHAEEPDQRVLSHTTHHLVLRSDLDKFYTFCRQLLDRFLAENAATAGDLVQADHLSGEYEEGVLIAQCHVLAAPLYRPNREYR